MYAWPWKGRAVLAERVVLDGTLDDLADAAVRSTVAFRRKRGEQLRVAFVAGRRLEERVQIATRCGEGARRVEVHAERLEDLGGVALELLPLLGRDVAGADLLPRRGLFGGGRKRGHAVSFGRLTGPHQCTAASYYDVWTSITSRSGLASKNQR